MVVMAALAAFVPVTLGTSAQAQSVRACGVTGIVSATATLGEPTGSYAPLTVSGTITGVEFCTGTGASLRRVEATVTAEGVVHRTTVQGVTTWDGEVDITVSDPGRGTSRFNGIGVTGDGTRWTSVGGTVRVFGSRQIATTIADTGDGSWAGAVAYH